MRSTAVWLHRYLGLALALGAAADKRTDPLLKALTSESTRRKPPPSRPPASPLPAPALSAMLEQALRLHPDGRITRVSLPSRPDEAVMVRMRLPGEIHEYGHTFVWFDRYDGTLLRDDNALQAHLATRVQNWFYPLHIGS